MAYTGGYILGILSPTIGNGKTTYTTDFDTSLQKIDEHDHASGKGKPIGTLALSDGAITTQKIAANAVTPAKLAACVTNKSLACNMGQVAAPGVANAETALTDSTVTPIKATIVSSGVRPVRVELVCANEYTPSTPNTDDMASNTSAQVNLAVNASGPYTVGAVEIRFYRDGVLLATSTYQTSAAQNSLPPTAFACLDLNPTPGSHDYTVKFVLATATLNFINVAVRATEL